MPARDNGGNGMRNGCNTWFGGQGDIESRTPVHPAAEGWSQRFLALASRPCFSGST